MKREMVFEQPEIYRCRFNGGVRIRVDIYPEDCYEAEKWARWLVGRRVEERMGGDVYEKIKNDVEKMFSEFDIDLKDNITEYFE